MTENALAIAIPAFNRPRALARLLRSLNAARFPQDAPVPLYFVFDSLEKGQPDPEVLLLAQDFSWNRGPKHILMAETALGLRGNILRCGDLTERHAGLIVLEDDLWLSPAFYEAAQQYSIATWMFRKWAPPLCTVFATTNMPVALSRPLTMGPMLFLFRVLLPGVRFGGNRRGSLFETFSTRGPILAPARTPKTSTAGFTPGKKITFVFWWTGIGSASSPERVSPPTWVRGSKSRFFAASAASQSCLVRRAQPASCPRRLESRIRCFF